MRQQTLGDVLEDLFDLEFSHRVTVYHLETGDVDNPDWERAAVRTIEVQLHPLTGKERQVRSENYGGAQVTHEAFCEADDVLVIGAKLVATHRRMENRQYQAIDGADQEAFTLLGKQRVPGLPEPWTQVQLDLSQQTPVR